MTRRPILFERAHRLAAVALEEKRASSADEGRTIILDAIRPLAIMLNGMYGKAGGERALPIHEGEGEAEEGTVGRERFDAAAMAAELGTRGAETVALLFDGYGITDVDPHPVYEALTAASAALSAISERTKVKPEEHEIIACVHSIVWEAYRQAVEQVAPTP